MRSFRLTGAALVLTLATVACGTARSGSDAGRARPTLPLTVAQTAAPSSTAPATRIATTTTGEAPVTTAVTTAVTSPTTALLPDPRLADVGAAGQAVVVTAAAYGDTTTTLTAYERTTGGWRAVLGPWAARVGAQGLAPAGEKREGDGRTPSGVFGFDFLFGVSPDPGVRFPYRRVTDRSIVWDDDPASPLYNEWVDADVQPVGADPEPMYVTPAYTYGAVIAYNTARTPGLGSAIFLHVSTGGPTAGCVSLPGDQLLQVLRWLDPARQPRIVLGAAR